MSVGLFALSVLLFPIELRLLWLGLTMVRRLSVVFGFVVAAGALGGLLAGFLAFGSVVATTLGLLGIFYTDDTLDGSKLGDVADVVLFLVSMSPFGHGLAFAAAGLAMGLQVIRIRGTSEDARTTRDSW